MADYTTFSRPGQDNGAGSTTALFMKQFAGEVLAAYTLGTVMEDKIRFREIANGKSAGFPVTGRATGKYHVPGTEISPGAIKSSERVITVDGLMLADTFCADWDEAINHWDSRGVYAQELGYALADVADKHRLMAVILAARASAVVDGLAGGTQITSDMFQNDGGVAGASTVAEKVENIYFAIGQAVKQLHKNGVKKHEPIFCALRPDDYADMVLAVQSNGFSLVSGEYGGQGSIADLTLPKVAGAFLVETQNLPDSNVAQGGDATHIDYYHYGDFSKTIATVFTKEAAGEVRLMNLQIQTGYDITRQGTLLVARRSVGLGTLRPECAVELKLDTLSNP